MSTAIRTVQGVADIECVRALAQRIWFEHYPRMLSWGQIHYMLALGYEAGTIGAEIARGVVWLIAEIDGDARGFCAYEADADGVKIHKLYVERAARGKGLARALIMPADRLAARRGGWLHLAVNKGNLDSIRAYQALGFAIAAAWVAPIGFGFVMDDYAMARPAGS